MVARAELPPLLVALAHALNSTRYLDPVLAPPLGQRGARQARHGGMRPDVVSEATRLAQEGISVLTTKDRLPEQPLVQNELLDASMSFLSGRLFEGAEGLLRHEICGPPEHPNLSDAKLSATVIGAGVSGLAAA